eukprot:TRINITY_DN13672_c0_g1_i3.p1 TRINITY_DN13672_c0_g1~~TRINITY_DN13672_c0_g1_i3.p1  ORF type:complete len:243 (+),score=24.91 TRINITY_DN13672_c0_g1_i3:106-834(+)
MPELEPRDGVAGLVSEDYVYCPSCCSPAHGPPGTTVACPKCGAYVHFRASPPRGPGQPQVMGQQQTAIDLKDRDVFGGRREIMVLQHRGRPPGSYSVGIPGEGGRMLGGSELLFVHDSSAQDPHPAGLRRDLTLDVRRGRLPDELDAMPGHPLVLTLHKPRQHNSCCCCRRPKFDRVADAAGRQIGQVHSPCFCVRATQAVFPVESPEVEMVTGPLWCCSPGLWLPCCAGTEVAVRRSSGVQ